MKTLTLISTLVIVSAPAFADSPAEMAAQHDFATSVVTDGTLGKSSPAEINGFVGTNGGDVISTQNMDMLRLLGADSPAEIASR